MHCVVLFCCFNDLFIIRALHSVEVVLSLSDTESFSCKRTRVNKESIK